MVKPERILYVGFEQLHTEYGILKDANPQKDLIVFVESQRQLTSRKWHRQRIFFMLSAVAHFIKELQQRGFAVEYVKSATTLDGLRLTKLKYPSAKQMLAMEPTSHRLRESLRHEVSFVENDFMLTPAHLFKSWAENQKSLLFESFYRLQRSRLNILMEAGKPIGGKWNFDADNRKKLPSNYQFAPYLEHPLDEIDQQIIAEIEKSNLNLVGQISLQDWATTRAGALRQLNYFIEHQLASFGPYEDAMTTKNWSLHHSLLSPYLNVGLLHPQEVLEAVRQHYRANPGIDLASLEGFIRQLIGWREYIWGVYNYFGDSYRDSNYFGQSGQLPPMFDDPARTKMKCLNQVLNQVHERGWVHHIPRLMVLSNFAQLTGTNPKAILDWMRRMFIDANDWVMVPNVIGMSMYADGGQIMSKPYIAGGSYISRMSNYCEQCPFNPKLRTGPNACPFTQLYWNFVDQNYSKLASNHRMVAQVAGIRRLSDLPEIRREAAATLDLIAAGNL